LESFSNLLNATNLTKSLVALLPLESYSVRLSLFNFSIRVKSASPIPIIIIEIGNSEQSTIISKLPS
jgi:hypothetical protein